MPKRVQRKRSKGWRTPSNCVYIGRPTIYGNPYKVEHMMGNWWRVVCRRTGNFGPWESGAMTRREAVAKAVEMYRIYATEKVRTHPDWIDHLIGKDLSCWCPLTYEDGSPHPCHVDVVLDLLAEREKTR